MTNITCLPDGLIEVVAQATTGTIISGGGSLIPIIGQNNNLPEDNPSEEFNHPFTKEAAIEFVKRSPLNSWMKGVCLSRIDNPDAVNHPRLLMMKIMEYVELNLKDAKSAKDVATVCALCQFAFEAKTIIFQRDELMVCNPECVHYNSGYAIKGEVE